MEWSVQLLRLGEFKLDAGCMFGIIPRVVWTRWVTPDELNRLPLQQNCLLLERDGRLVLIEPGMGDKLDEKERRIYAMEDRSIINALAEIDCDPADIDTVVCSHLHFDHAGGLTRATSDPARPALTFPNAEIVVQRQEWEDAIANRSTMHKTYRHEHLNKDVAERVHLIDGDAEILPGLRVTPMPGHTWGQQGILIDDNQDRTLVFVPDVMPTRYHCRPTTNLSYDVEPFTSMNERQKLLQNAADKGWMLVLDHEPGHAVFRAKDDPDTPGRYLLEETAF